VEDWQRRMVDPNWGGGKFGAPGIGGEELMLSALPGMWHKKFWKPGLAMTRQLNPQQLLRQMQRRLRGRDPSLTGPVRPRRGIIRSALRPQYGGPRGGRFRGQRYGPNKTIDDLRRDYDDVLR
jgi:hypothetical protein